jgi:FKBP-type peptidyl-prolyl cis-trans isomerase
MNRLSLIPLLAVGVSAIGIATATVESGSPSAAAPDAKAIRPEVSYALGFRAGNNFAQNYGSFGLTAEDIDQEQFIQGFMTALREEKAGIDREAMQKVMEQLATMLQAREKEVGAANLKASIQFLEENGKRKGVITTASGLQYEILTPGGTEKYQAPEDGKPANKQFLVNYKGSLPDGTQFDASPEGKPVTMTLQVVPGFREALTTMPVGAKWRLYLPPNLAYGEQRRGRKIGPNSALVFELELVSIQDAPAGQVKGAVPLTRPQAPPSQPPATK